MDLAGKVSRFHPINEGVLSFLKVGNSCGCGTYEIVTSTAVAGVQSFFCVKGIDYKRGVKTVANMVI